MSVPSSRRIEVYCETQAQKEAIEAAAQRSRRSVSRYALVLLLGSLDHPHVAVAKSDTGQLEILQQEVLSLREERDHLLTELRATHADLRDRELQIGRLAAQVSADDQTFVAAARTLLTLPNSPLNAVSEAELIIATGRVTSPAFIEQYQRRLSALVKAGTIGSTVIGNEHAYYAAPRLEDDE